VVTATPEGLVRAINVLANGGLAVIPTETVYGLAADATNAEAVARIFAAKGRPRINPLIIHLADAADAAQHAQLGPKAQALAEAFWPGPLTLVVLRRPDSPVAELACAGLDTIALRTPALPVAREIIRRLGRPLAAPSANLSGRLSTTTADDAAEDLSAAADLILDAGASPHGLESTIVGLPSHGPPRLLRPGAVPRESIEAIIGPLETPASGQGLQAPGMMASHYAPLARLRLNAALPAPGEAFLAFGPNAPDTPLLPNANLSPSGNLVEAAAQLYRLLRKLDAAGPAVIAVAPIPNIGLGEAINDRLARASAPRPGQF
jgi:L-threonylcarbamoyladenylate synthase